MTSSRRIFAVFDVDETLIHIKSMFSFMQFALKEKHGPKRGSAEFEHVRNRLFRLRDALPREEINREFYRHFKGWRITDFQTYVGKWFEEIIAGDLFIEPSLEKLRSHQAEGHEIVFLSGSAQLILEPLARYLDVSHLLAIRLATDGQGFLTGEIDGIQTIGDGKKQALVRFLRSVPDETETYGYGDHESDLPFLKCCDHQTLVVPKSGSQSKHGWQGGLALLEV